MTHFFFRAPLRTITVCVAVALSAVALPAFADLVAGDLLTHIIQNGPLTAPSYSTVGELRYLAESAYELTDDSTVISVVTGPANAPKTVRCVCTSTSVLCVPSNPTVAAKVRCER